MAFNRDHLPNPEGYYTERAGLAFLERKGKWRTTACTFHGGSDCMRINTDTGAFACMAGCGARGGDVLAYHMALTGCDFIAAAKELGAWVDDGKSTSPPSRPAPLSARDALAVLAFEATLVAVAAANVASGVTLSASDRARLIQDAAQINTVREYFQ